MRTFFFPSAILLIMQDGPTHDWMGKLDRWCPWCLQDGPKHFYWRQPGAIPPVLIPAHQNAGTRMPGQTNLQLTRKNAMLRIMNSTRQSQGLPPLAENQDVDQGGRAVVTQYEE